MDKEDEMQAIHNRIQNLEITVGQVANDVSSMRRDMAHQNESVQELVTAWNTAGGLVRGIKYISGFLAAIAIGIAAWNKLF